jgi:hypothetical protein
MDLLRFEELKGKHSIEESGREPHSYLHTTPIELPVRTLCEVSQSRQIVQVGFIPLGPFFRHRGAPTNLSLHQGHVDHTIAKTEQ